MLFDIKNYNATDLFVIYSESLYKCPIKADEETKQGLVEARRDWTNDQVVDPEQTDVFFLRALHNNQLYKEFALNYVETWPDFCHNLPPEYDPSRPRYKGTLVNGVYRRDNDEFVGWDTNKTVDQTHITLFSAMLPQYRDQGLHTEIEIAGSKYIFQIRNYQKSIARIPISESNSNWAIRMSEDFVSEVNETIDRGFPVRYGENTITKDSYNWWINQPENKQFKDAYFDYRDLLLPETVN